MSTASDDAPARRADRELLLAMAEPGPARQAAWSELVAAHSGRLYAVARSFRVDERTAEDLVQVAWLRLIERSQQVRDPDALGAWLCAIVRNEALRLLARRREVPTPLDLDQQVAPGGDPDRQLLKDERAITMRRAFDRLGEECRRLLTLVLADPPMSYDEIAAAVGRPRGSLGPSRRRCLEQMRRLLPAGFEP